MTDHLPDRLTDADFAELADHIQSLLARFNNLPAGDVKEDVFELLNSFDLLHREVFARWLELMERQAPHLLLALEQDFAIQTLLMLYGFIPEETVPTRPDSSVSFIPLDQLTVSPGLKQPIWLPGGHIDDIPPGTMAAKTFEDVRVLLCHIDGQLHAYHNGCIDSILPLDRGRLDGYMLTCPWHDCQYDLRTGEIQNGSGLKLEQYPVKVGEDGRFTVGFNIPKYGRTP